MILGIRKCNTTRLLNLVFITIFITILFSCKNDKVIKEIDGSINTFYFAGDGIKDSNARKSFDKGLKYVINNDHVMADSMLKFANKIEPKNIIIMNAFALNNFAMGNKLLAFDIFKEAIIIDSGYLYSYSNLAYCLNKEHKFKTTIKYLRDGLKCAKTDNEISILYSTMGISCDHLNECKLSIYYINLAIDFQKDIKILYELRKLIQQYEESCS